MIDIRARAAFKADFPDDGLENESGFILYPGRRAAAAVAGLLRGIGCEVSDPLHADDHGWELEIEFKRERMWGQVTSLDAGENILLFLDGAFMGNASAKPGYLEAVVKLNLAMHSDPRFQDIRWYRWRDPAGPAAGAPLDVNPDRLPKSVPKPAPKRGWFGWGTKEADGGKRDSARVRNKAKVGTDFPDDGTIEADGKIVRWGGKAVAAELAEILGRLGAEVSGPSSAEERGWVLDIRYKGYLARCQIEDGGGFIYLDIDDNLVADQPEYVDLVVQLNAELHRDTRFHNIRWYRRGEINMRGLSSDSPVYPTL